MNFFSAELLIARLRKSAGNRAVNSVECSPTYLGRDTRFMRGKMRKIKEFSIRKICIYALLEIFDGAQKRTRTSTPCGTRT